MPNILNMGQVVVLKITITTIDVTIAPTKFGKYMYNFLKTSDTKIELSPSPSPKSNPIQTINPIDTHIKFGKDRVNNFLQNEQKQMVRVDIMNQMTNYRGLNVLDMAN